MYFWLLKDVIFFRSFGDSMTLPDPYEERTVKVRRIQNESKGVVICQSHYPIIAVQ